MKRAAITILDAIADRALFAPWFKNEATWRAWPAFLTALYALPMTAEQLASTAPALADRATEQARHRGVAGLRPPRRQVVHARVDLRLPRLLPRLPRAPGAWMSAERVMVIAADRRAVAERSCGTSVACSPISPMLAHMIVREAAEVFRSQQRHPASKSPRRRSDDTRLHYCCRAAGRVAFLPTDDDAANPDSEVIAAIRPAWRRSRTPCCCVPRRLTRARGALWDAHRRHHGRDGDPVLVWQAPTPTMNPTVPHV